MNAQPRYSCIYWNRLCHRHCPYCDVMSIPIKGKPLDVREWIDVVKILDNLGIKFNLFLGNDALCFEDDFYLMVKYLKGRRDHAFYTAFHPEQFKRHRDKIISEGVYNMSGGIDVLDGTDIIAQKSQETLEGLIWLKDRGIPDAQGTITIHKKNLDQIEGVVDKLSKHNVWSGACSILWNLDGGLDAFSKRIPEFALDDTPEFRALLSRLIEGQLSGKYLIQAPPEYFIDMPKYGLDLSWHCEMPLIITIDVDGSLRCCACRKGEIMPELSIFDLGSGKLKMEDYIKLWKEDTQKCKGCYWAYAVISDFWYRKDMNFGDDVWKVHGSKYAPEKSAK